MVNPGFGLSGEFDGWWEAGFGSLAFPRGPLRLDLHASGSAGSCGPGVEFGSGVGVQASLRDAGCSMGHHPPVKLAGYFRSSRWDYGLFQN